jgi:hypothetical protein
LTADSTPHPGRASSAGASRATITLISLGLVGPNGQLPSADDERGGDGGNGAADAGQTSLLVIEDVEPRKGLRRGHKAGEQLVQVPAQPALNAGALPDQVFSVVDEQMELA